MINAARPWVQPSTRILAIRSIWIARPRANNLLWSACCEDRPVGELSGDVGEVLAHPFGNGERLHVCSVHLDDVQRIRPATDF
jgi:hypothetical protein